MSEISPLTTGTSGASIGEPLWPSCSGYGPCYVSITFPRPCTVQLATDTTFIAGLAASVNGYTESSWTGWISIYNLTFIVGMFISGVLFWVLSFTFRLHQDSAIITESYPTDESYHAEQTVNIHQTKETKPATSDVSV